MRLDLATARTRVRSEVKASDSPFDQWRSWLLDRRRRRTSPAIDAPSAAIGIRPGRRHRRRWCRGCSPAAVSRPSGGCRGAWRRWPTTPRVSSLPIAHPSKTTAARRRLFMEHLIVNFSKDHPHSIHKRAHPNHPGWNLTSTPHQWNIYTTIHLIESII